MGILGIIGSVASGIERGSDSLAGTVRGLLGPAGNVIESGTRNIADGLDPGLNPTGKSWDDGYNPTRTVVGGIFGVLNHINPGGVPNTNLGGTSSIVSGSSCVIQGGGLKCYENALTGKGAGASVSSFTPHSNSPVGRAASDGSLAGWGPFRFMVHDNKSQAHTHTKSQIQKHTKSHTQEHHLGFTASESKHIGTNTTVLKKKQ